MPSFRGCSRKPGSGGTCASRQSSDGFRTPFLKHVDEENKNQNNTNSNNSNSSNNGKKINSTSSNNVIIVRKEAEEPVPQGNLPMGSALLF